MGYSIFYICLGAFGLLYASGESKVQSVPKGKILIVYVTRTKNTAAVANMIQDNVGGDLVVLETEKPYPLDYKEMVAQVAQENDKGYLPPLKTVIEDLDSYDTIFVGFPTWGMQMPPPMKSFLSQHPFKGKTVIPFNTNAGYGVGSGFTTVEELCPEATILKGYTTQGGIERDGVLFVMKDEKLMEMKTEVSEWLQKIGVKQNRK